jgi:hypothetical protein
VTLDPGGQKGPKLVHSFPALCSCPPPDFGLPSLTPSLPHSLSIAIITQSSTRPSSHYLILSRSKNIPLKKSNKRSPGTTLQSSVHAKTLSAKALASDNEDPNDVEKPRVHLAEEALINLIGASVAHGHPWPSNGPTPNPYFHPMQYLASTPHARKKRFRSPTFLTLTPK